HAPEYQIQPRYTLKTSPLSSHSQILNMVGPPSQRVLDLGCGQADLARGLEARGHDVTAIDWQTPELPPKRFIKADFFTGLPLDDDEQFDVIVLADVLEHLPDPAQFLQLALRHSSANGRIIVSLPNAVHWSVRAQIMAGRF